MTDLKKIREAFERKAKALERRPAVGRVTAKTKVTMGEGFVCHIEDGPWKLTADFDKASGGNEEGPRPGTFGRTALGACLAQGYLMWAAKLDVPVSRIEVEVETDYDAAATYGVTGGKPGYQAIRYTVTVESSASQEAIERVLDKAEACSPYYDVFTRPQKLERTVRVLVPDKG